jgi:two-component system nitrogen regulation response regulator GlnG
VTDVFFTASGEFDGPTQSSDTQHTGRVAAPNARAVPALTILAHPDGRRVGDLAILSQGSTLVARAAPDFGRPDTRSRLQPLASDFLSKTPSVQLTASPDGTVLLARGASDHTVRVNGEELSETRVVPWSELQIGLVITIGSRFALCLHSLGYPFHRGPKMDFVGDSDAMEEVRTNIRRLADAEVPVLIRGESGTGKELFATALHTTGRRASGPFVPLNMGELGSTAAAELFGHEKGGFTGAVGERLGYFSQAHSGTIFLDEIGLASMEVQQMLLRVIENGEVRPIGAKGARRVDVRIIAATDADLEADVRAKRFHGPLHIRLSGFQVWLPPLRERRQDIGTLLHHFLRRSLSKLGAEHRLDQTTLKRPWLSAQAVARLALLEWPGNIRSLRNVAQQIAIGYHDLPEVDIEAALSDALGTPRRPLPLVPASSSDPAPAPAQRPERVPGPRRAPPAELSHQQVAQALHQHEGNMSAAAKALGIAKNSLYELARRHGIQTTSRIPSDELLAAHRELQGDLHALSRRFGGVSIRSLQLRLRHLGVPRDADDEPDSD